MKSEAYNNISERLEATFLGGSKGRIFCLHAYGTKTNVDETINESTVIAGCTYIQPKVLSPGNSGRHLVLFIPPFGEEVNLCRRFFSKIRYRLTQSDLTVVHPDLYGTGDSEGELAQAEWDFWQDDLTRVISHFSDVSSGGDEVSRLSIVALRAGCLLAQDLLHSLDERSYKPTIEHLIFVQPVQRGEEVVNRLFRARIMAQRFSGDRSQCSEDLWSLVEEGHNVHAGGHLLSAVLCQSLRSKTLDGMMTASVATHQAWFNLQSRSNEVVGERVKLSAWEVHDLTSTPFWQSYDAEPDTSLVDAVVDTIVRTS